jgi:cobalt/nickel transport system permease protein
MAGVHMLIGIGEGLISAMALLAVEKSRPEIILDAAPGQPRRPAELAGYVLIAALGLAIFVAPLACSWPDGLESAASRLGFARHAARPLFAAPAPEYRLPGIHWTSGATALAGATGVLVAFGLALLLGRALVPANAKKSEPSVSQL